MPRAKNPHAIPRNRYPWNEWQDGEEHAITEFSVTPNRMTIILHNRARRTGEVVKTTIEGDTLRFIFLPDKAAAVDHRWRPLDTREQDGKACADCGEVLTGADAVANLTVHSGVATVTELLKLSEIPKVCQRNAR